MEWMSYLGGFWIFPLLCLLFMALMMLMCGRVMFPRCHGGRMQRVDPELPHTEAAGHRSQTKSSPRNAHGM